MRPDYAAAPDQDAACPAAPWKLYGTLHLSIWRVPVGKLPTPPAAGTRVVAPACTVGPIWVDNEIAAAGGRTLWGIPKDLATFEPAPSSSRFSDPAAITTATMGHQGEPLAALSFASNCRIACPVRLSVWTVQDGPAGPLRTRSTLRGRLRPGVARWRFAADGPLGFLYGRRPLASVRLEGLTARFGV